MKNSATEKPASSFALLLIGRPGSGKTTLACQFPSPYLLDCDNNLGGPIRHLGSSHPFFYDTVNIDDSGAEVPPLSRYQRAAKLLETACASPDISTIIVDSITTFHEYILDEVRRQQRLSPGSTLQIQHWQSVAHLWKTIISTLRTTTHNIIFTGHTKLEKDELDGTILHHILIQGQMKDQIAGLFTDCWLAYVETAIDPNTRTMVGHRKIRTLQDSRYLDLKNSLGLPNVFPANPKEFIDKLS